MHHAPTAPARSHLSTRLPRHLQPFTHSPPAVHHHRLNPPTLLANPTQSPRAPSHWGSSRCQRCSSRLASLCLTSDVTCIPLPMYSFDCPSLLPTILASLLTTLPAVKAAAGIHNHPHGQGPLRPLFCDPSAMWHGVHAAPPTWLYHKLPQYAVQGAVQCPPITLLALCSPSLLRADHRVALASMVKSQSINQ